MDLATAQAFMRNPTVQRYVNQIDSDAQAALDAMASNSSALSMLPSSMRGQYRSDASALESAWDAFNTEWNRIEIGRAEDGRAAMSAYARYVMTLEVLETSNARFGAYVRTRVFVIFSALAATYLRHAKRIRKQMTRDLAFLRGLHRELSRARREVTEAHAQRVINACLTAVSLCITVSTFGAGLAVAGGLFALQTTADAALGPSGPSLPGSTNNAIGDLSGMPGMMRPAASRMTGAAAGFVSWSMDTDEIELAERNVTMIRNMMQQYNRAAPRLQRMLQTASREVTLARALYEGAVRQARSEARSFRAQTQRRRGLLRELSRLR